MSSRQLSSPHQPHYKRRKNQENYEIKTSYPSKRNSNVVVTTFKRITSSNIQISDTQNSDKEEENHITPTTVTEKSNNQVIKEESEEVEEEVDAEEVEEEVEAKEDDEEANKKDIEADKKDIDNERNELTNKDDIIINSNLVSMYCMENIFEDCEDSVGSFDYSYKLSDKQK